MEGPSDVILSTRTSILKRSSSFGTVRTTTKDFADLLKENGPQGKLAGRLPGFQKLDQAGTDRIRKVHD